MDAVTACLASSGQFNGERMSRLTKAPEIRHVPSSNRPRFKRSQGEPVRREERGLAASSLVGVPVGTLEALWRGVRR
jgi:hypothetical protein